MRPNPLLTTIGDDPFQPPDVARGSIDFIDDKVGMCAKMTERRPWNRLRKLAFIVLALAVVTFVLGLIIDEAALKSLALLLFGAASILNIFSIPSQQSD